MFNGLAAGAMAAETILLGVLAVAVALFALGCAARQPARDLSKWSVLAALAFSFASLIPIVNLAQGYPSHFHQWMWYLVPWTVVAFGVCLAALVIRYRALHGRATRL